MRMEVQNLAEKATNNETLIESIARDAGVELRDCYQCGKCAAGCPVSAHSDLTCRQVIRNLQLGLADAVLDAEMPWACLGCGMCLARCPQNVDLPSLMGAITRAAKAQGRVASTDAQRFQDVFLGIVKQTGLSNETLLAAGYNMTTGHLFQDVANVPAMWQKGLLDVSLPKRVENTAEIKAIFERCQNAQIDAGVPGQQTQDVSQTHTSAEAHTANPTQATNQVQESAAEHKVGDTHE